MGQIDAEYGQDLLRAESRGYRDGKKEASDEERQKAYREGWEAAVREIMGKCDSPARRTLEPLAVPEAPIPIGAGTFAALPAAHGWNAGRCIGSPSAVVAIAQLVRADRSRIVLVRCGQN